MLLYVLWVDLDSVIQHNTGELRISPSSTFNSLSVEQRSDVTAKAYWHHAERK